MHAKGLASLGAGGELIMTGGSSIIADLHLHLDVDTMPTTRRLWARLWLQYNRRVPQVVDV